MSESRVSDRVWVALPLRLTRSSPGLGLALADGAYLRGNPVTGIGAPVISFALGALFALLRDPQQTPLYSASLLAVLIGVALSSLGSALGVWMTLGWALVDLPRGDYGNSHNYAREGIGSVLDPLLGRLGGVSAALVLALLLVAPPLAASVTRVATARALGSAGRRSPGGPAADRAVAPSGSGGPVAIVAGALTAALMVYSWAQVSPVLLRPVFIWPDGSPPTLAIEPVQNWGWLLAGVALAVTAIRGWIEPGWRARLPRRVVAAPSIPARSTVGRTLRAAAVGVGFTLVFAGAYSSWFVGVVALVVFVAAHVVRRVILAGGAWERATGRIPALVRGLVVLGLGFALGRWLILSEAGMGASNFNGVTWTVLLTACLTAVLLPGAGPFAGPTAPRPHADGPAPGTPSGPPSAADGPRVAAWLLLAAMTVSVSWLGDVPTARADNCSSPSDCFLSLPFLMLLVVLLGLLLFGAGWFWAIAAVRYAGMAVILAGFLGLEFGLPLTTSDPSDPTVGRLKDLVDRGANERAPGSGGPDIGDIARASNPTGGTSNCGSIAEAVDSTLGGHPAAERGIGDVNEVALQGRHGATFQSAPSGTSTEGFVDGTLSHDGDRGIIEAQQDGSGHVFNAVNIDGDVWYINGQDGYVTSSLGDMLNHVGYTHPDSVQLLQTHP